MFYNYSMNNKKPLTKNKALIIFSICVFCGCIIGNYLFNSVIHPELSMISIITNPLLITISFICITDISNPDCNKIPLLLSVINIFLILLQHIYLNNTGTLLLIILTISLLYYSTLTKRLNGSQSKLIKLSSYFTLIMLCLLEHSLALAIIISILILFITSKDKLLKKSLLIDIIVSTITLIISKCYQYFSLKAISYSSEWSNLSLWKKFASGYDSFFLPMFKYNTLTLIILSICLIILVLKKNTNKVIKYISIVINIICILLLFVKLPWYIEYIFWPIYILVNLITLIKVPNNKLSLTFYIVAGLSAFFVCFQEQHEMYYSIYTFYYVILVANEVINDAINHKSLN